jgi:AraC-like DNA-binding protein
MAGQRDPIREWREQFARKCLNIDFEPLSETRFRFSLKPIFEDLRVARVAFSPGFTFRDKDLVKDGEDTFVLFISQSRSIDVTLQGRTLRLGYGDATLFSADTTGRVGSHLGMVRTAVMIPRAEFAACGIRPANTMMQRLPQRSEGLRLLRAYLRSLERAPVHGSAEIRDTLRRHIIELSALALMAKPAIGESDLTAVAAARVAAALEHIARHFQEPGLRAEAVAQRQGISPRYLQRLLETTGKSFVARVNELRLQQAFKLLAGTHESGYRISDVALQVGFSDISHFNRLFRSRFGDTPTGVRAGRSKRQRLANRA